MAETATDFEVFRYKNRKHRKREATVTVSRFGMIYFSQLAFELLGKPEAVAFLYSRNERVIGFRPAGKGEDDTYTFRASSRAIPSRTVSGTSFCKHVGLTLEESRRWPLVMRDGIGTIDVSQPGIPVGRNGNVPEPA